MNGPHKSIGFFITVLATVMLAYSDLRMVEPKRAPCWWEGLRGMFAYNLA